MDSLVFYTFVILFFDKKVKVRLDSEITSGFIQLQNAKRSYFMKGTTGFDSKVSENVSIPRSEMKTRKTYFKQLNGENNYALAA